jgi:hypothetical protein
LRIPGDIARGVDTDAHIDVAAGTDRDVVVVDRIYIDPLVHHIHSQLQVHCHTIGASPGLDLAEAEVVVDNVSVKQVLAGLHPFPPYPSDS